MKILKKILKNIPILLLDFLFWPIWKISGLVKRNDNLWIFVSWFGNKYNDSSRIFFEWVNANCKQIHCIWISKDKEITQIIRNKGYEAYNSKSLKALWYSLRAKNIFSTTGYEMLYGFTNGSNIYELWHGMPLKKILKDDDFSAADLGNNSLYKVLHNLNEKCFKWKNILTLPNLYTITNSDFFIPYLKTAFNLSEDKILKIGLPRNDALFYNNDECLINEIRIKFPGCKIVLYMPTFRQSSITKEAFNAFSDKYNFNKEKFIKTLNDENVVFLYKPHFYDLQYFQNFELSDRFYLLNDNSYEEQYNFIGQCDVLVTDYSSIYFDFIITKKEVILAPFDLDFYLKSCRSQYFNYSELIGEKVSDWNALLDCLSRKNTKKQYEDAISKFAQYSDGMSCIKLYERITK